MTTSPTIRTLADLTAHWVEERPESIAVTFGDRSWTWRAWAGEVDSLAAAMASEGLGRGSRVGVLDKNHPVCLQVLFASGRLGAAVGILNWRLAPEELVYVINDCGAEILFVGEEFLEVVTSIRAQLPNVRRVVVVDGAGPNGQSAFLSAATGVAPQQSAEPDDLLMLMYSSGTTGQPKGVMLSHHAMVTHTRSVGAAFPFGEGDKNLVAMPLFHVGGTSYALIGLAAGVETIMTREPDAPSLIGALHAGSTHTFFVPPVIAAFLNAGGAAVEAMARLRYLGYGAAPMPLPLLQNALAVWPRVNFVQVYGQTELSGAATVLTPEDHRNPEHPEWLLSAGMPVAGLEVKVVDVASGEDVATNELGEVWIRSDQRMTGYLNQPDATRDTITPDGWVRTGDVGRVDETGHLFIEDRLKDLIITGGENVYGPEVERVLMQHPSVLDAAVIGVPDTTWGEAVMGIVVVTEPTEAEDIIAFCREHLAGYKCPRTIQIVEALPRNASGKILKRQLRSPYWADRGRAI